MKYTELISGIIWLVFGILISVWSTSYKIGSLTRPGPGFLPLALGLLLILLSLILLRQTQKASTITQRIASSSPPGRWKKVAFTGLILLLVPFLFETMGYLLTIFLLIVFLMLGAELKSWKKTLFVAFFSALGVYLVFVLLLKQQLPRGFLGI